MRGGVSVDETLSSLVIRERKADDVEYLQVFIIFLVAPNQANFVADTAEQLATETSICSVGTRAPTVQETIW